MVDKAELQPHATEAPQDRCGAGGNDSGIGVSMECCRVGSVIARECVGDPRFMAEDNWSAELAVRIFRQMVAQAICEGTLAIGEGREPRRASHPPFSALVPRLALKNGTRERAG